jgi:hypothetical protein
MSRTARMFDIVRRGVPGTERTGADPLRVLDKDIWQTLAYMRTRSAVPAAAPTGDAVSGERVFRANCAGLSPGQRTRRATRSRSLAHRIGEAPCPISSKIRGLSELIRSGYEPVTLLTRDGERIRGVRKFALAEF